VPLQKVTADLKKIKRGLIAAGVARNLIESIETRALRSGRRQTETAAEAIALLDRRFPWLRGCELRTTRRPAA
jgi:hypothetical protein